MKIALVYDRVNKIGGAERVLEALHELYPDAPLFTLVYDEQKAPWSKEFQIYTSFLQQIPFAKSNHEYLPLLAPLGFERFDFTGYEVVISVTSSDAKGIITGPDTLHICYLLTPTRYLWSHYEEYVHQRWLRLISSPAIMMLRLWDFIAAQRPDRLIAISHVVQKRIKKYYHRESDVIYPPAYLDAANHSSASQNITLPKVFFLVVSRLVRYKRIELAIQACNKLHIPLYIIGTGKDRTRLESIAGPDTFFLGNLTDDEISFYYQKARALIMPQTEDFGIVALESLSSGTPVISYAKSGTSEIIQAGRTGELFFPQTSDALVTALEKSLKNPYSRVLCRQSAKKYSKEVFKQQFSKLVQEFLTKSKKDYSYV